MGIANKIGLGMELTEACLPKGDMFHFSPPTGDEDLFVVSNLEAHDD